MLPKNNLKYNLKAATQKQISTILAFHNKYRKMHGADPLVYDPNISSIAQSYADQLAATNSMSHSGNTYQGDYLKKIILKDSF